MNLDIDFFIQIIAASTFMLLFLISLIFAVRSKKEYKRFFVLVALIALFCVLDQVFLFLNDIFFPNLKDLVEGIIVASVAVTALILAKTIAKLT
jgi:hypothetical protein